METYYYNDSENQGKSNLVFCIEEYDKAELGNVQGNIDMRLFLFYHKDMKQFVIFGRRDDKENSSREYVPFHFTSKKENAVFNFIKFVVDSESKHSIVLYNYNNLYDGDEEPSCYEHLEENMDRDYELGAYDNMKMSRNKMMKYLSMLKHIQ